MAEEQYFFVPPALIDTDRFKLPDNEAYHFRQVLRKGKGDLIWIIDGEGKAYRTRITEVEGETVTGRIIETVPNYGESRNHLHLGIGIIKKDKLEWVVEKATELGVRDISILSMEKSVKKNINQIRLKKIIRSAMKQCGRSFEPSIIGPVSLVDWLQKTESNRAAKLVCHPGGLKLSGINRSRSNAYDILVGPEGGFSENELLQAEQFGFNRVDLGERRLRSETAAITTLAVLSVR